MMILSTLFILLGCLGRLSSAQEPCGKPADIAFVIDSSSSIWIYDFNKQIEFVVELVKQFDIGPEKTQVAALTFSKEIVQEFHFKDFDNSADIIKKVKTIGHKSGQYTNTHGALKEMHEDLFGPHQGARKDIPHICILLTDGKATQKQETFAAAIDAKNAGIKIIGIGIGNKVNQKELETIVSKPVDENLFLVDTFGELNSENFQQLVAHQACKATETTTAAPPPTTTTATTTTTTMTEPSTTTTTTEPTTTMTEPTTTTTEPTTTTTTREPTTTTTIKPKTTTTTTTEPPTTTTEMIKTEPKETCQGKEADIVFVMDMSSSIWTEYFKEQLIFVTDVISSFDLSKTQVAAVVFSDGANIKFYLDEYTTQKEISDAILHIKSEGGVTNTHLALETLDDIFSKEQGARPNVAHICVVITDGKSRQPDLTVAQAQHVHDNGVYVFAIGVGNQTDISELKQMASQPTDEYTFEVNGYKALKTIENILAYKTCEVPQGDQPRCINNMRADLVFGLLGVGGGDQRANVLEFIKRVGGAFDMGSGKVRIAMREECGNASVDLKDFNGREEFDQSVTGAMKMELTPLLYSVRQAFGRVNHESKTGRIAVIITAGEFHDKIKARKEVRYLKYSSRLIIVQLGKAELPKIGTSKHSFKPDTSHEFQVKDSSDLAYYVKKLHMLMCKDQ